MDGEGRGGFVEGVEVQSRGAGKLMLMVETPEQIDATYDLRSASFFGLIRDATVTMLMAPTMFFQLSHTLVSDA